MTAESNIFLFKTAGLTGGTSPLKQGKAPKSRSLQALCSTALMLSLITPAQASAADQKVEPNKKSASTTQASPLKGSIHYDVCPFKEDHSTETIEKGTPLNVTVRACLNSELSRVGDEIRAEVSTDLKDGNKVVLPGKWQIVGKVARVEKQKRMGRDGYIELKFDKLVSPDGKWEVPLDASASTKESTAKTVTRQAATTAGYTTVGAIGGSLLSVQLTGLPVAIATHGISVGVGAAVGATLGVVAVLHRKGNILSAEPGEEIQIRLPNSITIPAFKQEMVPSKAPDPELKDVGLTVKDFRFRPFPLGDKKSRLLDVSFAIENNGKTPISFANIGVTCNHNHSYMPYLGSEGFFKERAKTVGPNAVQESTLTFQVGSPKLKYSLVILDQANSHILSRVAIN